ncbi:MAG TPA: hypothetical protein VN108_09750 [Marmoricola sp.]|nr:hypothetical protein [Marmoricola sp.]
MPASVDPTRAEQRILEAVPRIPPGGAITGWASLRVWGGGFFDGLAADGVTEVPVPLVVPQTVRLSPSQQLHLFRAAMDPREIRNPHGFPISSPERAVLDEVRRATDLRDAVVVVDMALVAGLTSMLRLHDIANAYRGRPGCQQLGRALAHASDRSRSPQETRMRLIWTIDAGLPAPRCNWPIADYLRKPLGKPDLLCEELGVFGEYDGADHRTRQRHQVDVKREQAFRDAGLEGFTLVGEDINNPRQAVERMKAAINRAAEAQRARRWLVARNPGPLLKGANLFD